MNNLARYFNKYRLFRTFIKYSNILALFPEKEKEIELNFDKHSSCIRHKFELLNTVVREKFIFTKTKTINACNYLLFDCFFYVMGFEQTIEQPLPALQKCFDDVLITTLSTDNLF